MTSSSQIYLRKEISVLENEVFSRQVNAGAVQNQCKCPKDYPADRRELDSKSAIMVERFDLCWSLFPLLFHFYRQR